MGSPPTAQRYDGHKTIPSEACRMLADIYGRYIACLNARDWPNLGAFVHDAQQYNGRALTLDDYRELLEGCARDSRHPLRYRTADNRAAARRLPVALLMHAEG